jgi:TPR repeat protein
MSKRIERAEKRYRKDAEKGEPAAQFSLGHAYYLEALEANDYAVALHWIHKAAAQNYDYALANLGYMHELGEGVVLDLAQSQSWFRRAAEQGDRFHQHQYATLCWNGDFSQHDYLTSDGLYSPQDPSESEIWWLKAANQGSPFAQDALGRYYSGWMCAEPKWKNCVAAYMWLTLAALQDEPGHNQKASRSQRNQEAEEMTPEQIAEAEDLVQSWMNERAEEMGGDLVVHWRERVAEPLTEEEIAEARVQVEAFAKKFADGPEE